MLWQFPIIPPATPWPSLTFLSLPRATYLPRTCHVPVCTCHLPASYQPASWHAPAKQLQHEPKRRRAARAVCAALSIANCDTREA
eukprot:5899445-Pleurochrysis_carterae.AAC.5